MTRKRFNPEQHWKQVNDAVSKMKHVKELKGKMNDPMLRLMDALANMIVDVNLAVRPILKAGGGFDEAALKQTVFETCLDKVTVFSKDELQILICITVADAVMSDIQGNPSGNDKPDLLSGQ
jgi:hypothetical protein